MFCAKMFLKHALKYLQPDRAKCGTIFVFAPAEKKPEHFEKIEGRSIRVWLLETARAAEHEKHAKPSSPLPVIMEVTMIVDTLWLDIASGVFVGERFWGVLLEPACLCAVVRECNKKR